MIIFCEECGGRNHIDISTLDEKSEIINCRICNDIIPISKPDGSASVHSTDHSAKYKILLVDDISNNRLILEMVLEDEYLFVSAANGAQALQLAAEHQPDLILLDIILPDIDGYEVCRRLKADKKTRQIPIIFVTAKDATVDEEKGLKIGAVDYLSKPISAPIVKARVALHLQIKRQRDHIKKQAIQFSLANKQLKNQIESHQLAETKLDRVNQNWEQTFDAIGDMVTIQDEKRKILRANKAAHRYFAHDTGNLVGRYCYELFCGEQLPCRSCPDIQSFSESDLAPIEMRYVAINRTFQVSNSPIFDKRGEWMGWVHIAKDVTERKQSEPRPGFDRTMVSFEKVISGMANNFRNVFQMITANCSLAQQKHPSEIGLPELKKKILASIKKGSRLCDALDRWRQLLYEQKTELKFCPLDLASLLRDVGAHLESSSGNKISIQIDVPRSLSVHGDGKALERMLSGLCENACDAMQDGGNLNIKARKAGQNAWISIRDSGQGLDAETCERCFDPVYATRNYHRGIDLTLSMAHDLVVAHGGEIRCESVQGQGTMIQIKLPLMIEGQLD
jgi:two-component system cell cycle sensor histidine kinase/response regulator CckA